MTPSERKLEPAANHGLGLGAPPPGETAPGPGAGEAGTLSAAQRAILKKRAQVLARVPKGEGDGGECLEVVEFLLAYETYGIESSYIREVYPLKELTPLPGTPPFVLGIINVRGQILSVIDLKKFFDLPEKGLTDLNRVIIIQAEKMEFGILADAIHAIRHIPVREIQPSLPTLTGIRAEYLRGVTGDRLVVLNVAKILADPGLVVHEEVPG
jgi:purine-binding chemotaxis protein CheW